MEDDTGEENPHNRYRISELYVDYDQSFKNLAKQQLAQYCQWAVDQLAQGEVFGEDGGSADTTTSRNDKGISVCQCIASCVKSFNHNFEFQMYTRALSSLEQAKTSGPKGLQDLTQMFSSSDIDCSGVLDAVYTLMSLVHFKTCIVYHSQFDKALEELMLLVLQLVNSLSVQTFLGMQNRPLVQRKLKSIIYCELSIIGFRSSEGSTAKYAQLGLECYDGLAELWNVLAHMSTLKSGTTLADERQIATEALEYHARSIELYPRGSIYYMNRAILKMGKLYRLLHRLPHADRAELGDRWDPMPDFERSLQLNPHNDTALISRAREYKYRGDNVRAVEDYKAAVESCNMQKTYVIAYYLLELAELVDSMGDSATAIRYFTESLRYEDTKPRPYQGRARAYMKMSEFVRAYQDYIRVHKMPNENWTNTLQQQFHILRALGQHDLAFAKVNELFRTPAGNGGKNPYPARFPERALLYATFGERYLSVRDHMQMNMFETENGATYRKQLAYTMADEHDEILELME